MLVMENATLLLAACSLKSLGHVAKVHDLPHRLQVVGSHVLVLQVVRVLPHVYAKQWDETLRRMRGVHATVRTRSRRGQ